MAGSLEDLNLADARMVSVEDKQIRVLLDDYSEVIFKFESREQMDAMLEHWVSSREGKGTERQGRTILSRGDRGTAILATAGVMG